jgi:hypothetical protein
MKKLLLVSTLALSTSLLAAPVIPLEHQISSIETYEVSGEELMQMGLGNLQGGTQAGAGGAMLGLDGGVTSGSQDPRPTIGDRAETAGKVISAARDMVALGEAIYELVKKGKPSNVTEYAPISVVPRDPMTKEIADVFDLEGFSMPVERNFVSKIKNGTGKEVVVFNYKVMYSYGGSYNGSGKYLTNVIIVPSSVRTSFGWEFNASMKLSGMMNHGSRANPIAGVMVTMKYQMNGWSTSFERNDTIHITGNGQLKNHNI